MGVERIYLFDGIAGRGSHTGLPRPFDSKLNPQSKLNVSRRTCRSSLSKPRSKNLEVGTRDPELGVVEGIEELSSKPDSHILRDGKTLGDRNIPVIDAGTGEYAAPRVSKGSQLGIFKSICVEVPQIVCTRIELLKWCTQIGS